MTLSLRHTLKSERGASMSMALMTFLVCTMVASVTITAATAVLGRQEHLNKADVSYYNVTSAARVFWDELADGHVKCTITRSCVATRDDATKSYTNPDDWWMSLDDRGETYGDQGLNLNSDHATLWQILSADYVFEEEHTNYEFTVTPDDVKFELSEGDLNPGPGTPKPNPASYSPIRVTVQPDSSIPAVLVRVNRDGNGSYRFVFEQDNMAVNEGFRATLFAKASATTLPVHKDNSADGTSKLKWETTVRWTPISMKVGGA